MCFKYVIKKIVCACVCVCLNHSTAFWQNMMDPYGSPFVCFPKGCAVFACKGAESWDLSLDLWDFCNSDALSSVVFGKGALSFQRAARETACDLAVAGLGA